MNRQEYLLRAREQARRGTDLPQTILTTEDVSEIRSAQRQRESLRTHIRENLGNDALAKKYGVTTRTIEKVMSRESWPRCIGPSAARMTTSTSRRSECASCLTMRRSRRAGKPGHGRH
jgi:hypothetical protein